MFSVTRPVTWKFVDILTSNCYLVQKIRIDSASFSMRKLLSFQRLVTCQLLHRQCQVPKEKSPL